MTHSEFQRIAEEHGFKRVYFTVPMKFDLGCNRFRLTADVLKEFPFADCIAILVYPYAPFTPDERIPAYYLASNRAYHAGSAFIKVLAGLGIYAERANIPIKLQLERQNIGTRCRNSLISVEPFGTRIVFSALAVKGIQPLEYTSEGQSYDCGNCTLCISACPCGAVSKDGLTVEKCMRFHMESASHPDWVRKKQKTFIGCEICQYACKRNAALKTERPGNDAVSAFELARLIKGDTADARRLAGRNITGNGKLTAEALVFAAYDGILTDELLNNVDLRFDSAKDALRFISEGPNGCGRDVIS